jgi:capsular exopolysaccharide synthesis family protein
VELRHVLAALRAAWWLPVAGLVLGGAAGLTSGLLQTPLYTASTQLFVATTGSTAPPDILAGGQFSQQRVISYARLITGPELAQSVVDQLGLQMSAQELSSQITATPDGDTVLIDVTVTDPSATRAQRIAAVIGPSFATMATQLESGGPANPSPVKVTVTQSPDLPTAPTSPRTARNAAFGLLAGLLLGGALAIVRARLDPSIRDPDEAAELAAAPLLGTVARDDVLKTRLALDRGTGSRAAEDFKLLRTNLLFLRRDAPSKAILVSGAVPSQGATTVVVNLALALADAGRRVTIVDADLRGSRISRALGLEDVGLASVLADGVPIADVIQPYRNNVSVITAGLTPPDPGELLASGLMTTVVERLRQQSDFVLLDAPPLLSVADSCALAAVVDGVLLTVRYGGTDREQLRRAAVRLQQVHATTLGVILNVVPARADQAVAYANGAHDHAATGRQQATTPTPLRETA